MARLKDGFRIELDNSRLSFSDSPIFSPVTNLAINLEDLNASLDGTPKRKISWSSTGSTSPCRPHQLSFKDDGFFDSPATQEPTAFQGRLPRNLSSEQQARVFRKVLQSTGSQSPTGPSPAANAGKENIRRWSNNSLGTSPVKEAQDIEDVDTCSRDSGFSDKEDKMDFHFTEPKGLPPRRQRCSSEQLPMASGRASSSFSYVENHLDVFDSILEDTRDGDFPDLLEQNSVTDKANFLPVGLMDLIEGNLQYGVLNANISKPRSPLKELCSSLNENALKGKGCSRGLFGIAKSRTEDFDGKSSFKRPEPPKDLPSPIQNKRRRSVSFCCRKPGGGCGELSVELPKKVNLHRCWSETQTTIMKAVQRSDQEPNLIGDFTKQYILPLVPGKHQDLKSISHDTVKRLLVGEYGDVVEKCVIVDCRYPYEFEGGHIKSALNVYTKERIIQEFLCTPMTTTDPRKRLVVIFHCEFSSERGPNLSRFLRNKDREANKDCYPHLHYPEIYLLEGGYKDFYENNESLCEPRDYKPMLHKDHEKDLKHFRAKSKSWNGDRGNRTSSRAGFKF